MKELYDSFPQSEEEYLKSRVVDQIKWYDKKSILNKKWFLSLKIIEILVALCIPFATAYITESTSSLKIVVGVFGVLIAAIAGILTLIKFQENWIEYRTITESLKLEKFLFLAKAGPYKNTSTAFQIFVERFESLISNSNKRWADYISNKDIESDPKNND